jgi:trehalose synthase
LAPYLRSAGAGVIWNCHVGSDVINDATEVVWSFLRPFVEAAHA